MSPNSSPMQYLQFSPKVGTNYGQGFITAYTDLYPTFLLQFPLVGSWFGFIILPSIFLIFSDTFGVLLIIIAPRRKITMKVKFEDNCSIHLNGSKLELGHYKLIFCFSSPSVPILTSVPTKIYILYFCRKCVFCL
jgi:hypothetical protein